MGTLDVLHIEVAADVPEDRYGVEFTERGEVCYHPIPGTGDDGVFCMVDSLPERLKERMEKGHRMAKEALALLVEAMREAQALGHGPDDAMYPVGE